MTPKMLLQGVLAKGIAEDIWHTVIEEISGGSSESLHCKMKLILVIKLFLHTIHFINDSSTCTFQYIEACLKLLIEALVLFL